MEYLEEELEEDLDDDLERERCAAGSEERTNNNQSVARGRDKLENKLEVHVRS